MKFFILLSLVAATASARNTIPKSILSLSEDMVDYVNAMNTTWKAGTNFEGVSLEHIRGLMGVHKDNDKHRLPVLRHEIPNFLPENFDARDQWPFCPSISEITDQGSCGSCWAIGTASVISDRYCIHSGGKITVEISAEDILTCCKSCGFGCNAGFPNAAWKFWVHKGIVTGGLYNSHRGCQPYTVSACEHNTKRNLPPCGDIIKTPRCVRMCQEGYSVHYWEDKHFGKKTYSIENDVEQIQTEIFKNGPVQASFTVYGDFLSYKSGVYQRHSDEDTGDHSCRILGWGEDNGVPYWLATNSWNADWGDKGRFKILRGVDECGIEGSIVAGLP